MVWFFPQAARQRLILFFIISVLLLNNFDWQMFSLKKVWSKLLSVMGQVGLPSDHLVGFFATRSIRNFKELGIRITPISLII